MTISDEERREVAQRLRENIDRERVRYDLDLVHEVTNVLGWEILEHGFTETLADLIDRPTCELVVEPGGKYCICSRCGCSMWEPDIVDSASDWRYCINCGAEVVE